MVKAGFASEKNGRYGTYVVTLSPNDFSLNEKYCLLYTLNCVLE